jgi:hypothetical protein
MPAWTAPVSHQKRPERNATNAVGIQQNREKINELEHYLAAHNGLVAGSIASKPATLSMAGRGSITVISRLRPKMSQYSRLRVPHECNEKG